MRFGYGIPQFSLPPLSCIRRPWTRQLALFLCFLIANLLIVPLGLLAIAMASQVLRVPKLALAPLILGFCVVGAYSIDSAASGIVIMLILGIFAYLMERTDFR